MSLEVNFADTASTQYTLPVVSFGDSSVGNTPPKVLTESYWLQGRSHVYLDAHSIMDSCSLLCYCVHMTTAILSCA